MRQFDVMRGSSSCQFDNNWRPDRPQGHRFSSVTAPRRPPGTGTWHRLVDSVPMSLIISSRLAAIPHYEPGLTTADVLARYGLDAAVKLASNESPYPPLEAVQAVLHDGVAGLNRYPDGAARALRAEIAERHGLDPGQVAIGNGSCELVLLAGQALLGSRHHAGLPGAVVRAVRAPGRRRRGRGDRGAAGRGRAQRPCRDGRGDRRADASGHPVQPEQPDRRVPGRVARSRPFWTACPRTCRCSSTRRTTTS